MRLWLSLSVFSLLFALLSVLLVSSPELLNRFDEHIRTLVLPLQSELGITLFLAITALGGATGIILVAVAFAYFARLSTLQVFQLTALLIAAAVANRLLKEFFARARPESLPWVDTLSTYAFPSAHASSIFVLYAFIASVLYVRTRHWLAILIPALIILGVGLSRIVLSAHHATDVIGGYLLGAALLSALFLIPLRRYG